MALNFPASPSAGDVHNASNGLQYHFDGVKWVSQGAYNTSTINTLNFTQQGTGAVRRSVQNKLEEFVHVEDYGAVGNGTTNDTTAFQNAIDYVAGQGGGTVHFNKKHLIDSALTVKDYVTLKGSLDGGPDELRGSTADNVTVGGESNVVNYDQMAGQLIINSSTSITFRDGAGLCGALVMRKGLDLPFANSSSAVIAGIAAFAGTALTVGGAGATFKYLLVLGFNKAIFSDGFERVTVDNVRGDCTNGIEIKNCLDISYISNCHFFPYTTTHQAGTGSSGDGTSTNTTALAGRQSLRGGVAYKFDTVADWSKLTNCFSFGYYTGFQISSCNDVQLIGCGADWVAPSDIAQNGTFNYTTVTQATYPTQSGVTASTNGYTSVGFLINGSCNRIKLIGCQTASQMVGYVVNLAATNNSLTKTTFTDCSSWDINQTHVFVKNGFTSFLNCSYTDNSSISDTGIRIDAAADKATILACHFGNINDPINPQSSTIILHNTYESCGSTDFQDPDSASLVTTLGDGSSLGNQALAKNLRIISSDTGSEGGQIDFQRAADSTYVFAIDVNGSGTSDVGILRIIDSVANAVRFQINATGGVAATGIANSTTSSSANVFVTGGGTLQKSTSSQRYKTSIETLEDKYADAILQARPVWYKSLCDADNKDWGWWGFIAEEIAAIDPRLVNWNTNSISYDSSGNIVETPLETPIAEGVAYDRFVPHLINLIKRQQTKIESLEARITKLEG